MAMKNGMFSALQLQPCNNMLNLAYNVKANVTDEEVRDIRNKFLDQLFDETLESVNCVFKLYLPVRTHDSDLHENTPFAVHYQKIYYH